MKQNKNTKKATPKKAATKKSAQQDVAKGLAYLFAEQLKDIYWAEKALVKALPKMAKNASTEELRTAFEDHLAVTEGQVDRLEQVFELIGKKAQAKKCEAMEGLLKEAQEIMESTEEGKVRDAAMIGAAQKVEHYEIASYGTLAAWAEILGETESAELLQETLEEEKSADEELSSIAGDINTEADDSDDDDEAEEDASATQTAGDVYVKTKKSGSKGNI